MYFFPFCLMRLPSSQARFARLDSKTCRFFLTLAALIFSSLLLPFGGSRSAKVALILRIEA
jgi:hypothetical protein